MAGRRDPIPRPKINGLLAALERDHVVRFNTGRSIEYIDCPSCEGTGKRAAVMKHSAVVVDEQPCDRCGGEKVLLLVIGLANGRSRYRLDLPGEVERAYKMALYGPAPGPSVVTGKWYRPDDPRLDRFGDCPF